jgi:hypothetical protein
VAGGSGATITPPSGWTQITGTNETTDILTRAYWHQATGYDSASYTWTFDAARQASGVMTAYSGTYPNIPRTFTTTVNSTASTTTASGTGNSTYETGLSIQVFGAYNTSAATTMTSSGGYAQRADTCTTATPFIEVAIQDVSKVAPLGGMSANAATISSAATSTSINFMLEDLRALNTLVEDEMLVGNKIGSPNFTSFATGTFPVNYPNEVILLFGSIAKDTNTISSVTGGGLTWVNVGRANTNAGSTEVWRAFAPTSQSFALTITMSAATVSFSYLVVGIIGADMTGTSGSGAIGALNTAASTSAAPTVSVTTTRNNSWVWAAGNDPANASGATSAVAGSGQLLLRNSKDTTNACSGWTQRQTALTPVSGTSVTMNNTAPTDSCNILAVEILPAIHYNLGATGVG